jgi:hypothetical protein
MIYPAFNFSVTGRAWSHGIITLAAIAFAILILPLAGYAQNSSPIPAPGVGLLPGSELSPSPEQYQGQEPFCSDDIVSRTLCQPLVDNTPKVMGLVCQSYRAGNLPDVTFHPGAGFVSVSDTDLQQFCDRFFPLPTGTLCQLDGAECKLPAPMPLGSKCQCTLPFGAVAGTVAN